MHIQLEQISSTRATNLLPGVEHQTPWSQLRLVDLADGEHVDVGDRDEATLLLLQGEGITCEGAYLQAPAAATIVAQAAAFIARGPARLLIADVALESSGSSSCRADLLDAKKLTWRTSIHGGGGRIATRHLWRPEDFHGDGWIFVDHAILGQDSSLGYHYHDALEEAFVVLTGQGWMTIGERTFHVGPGSVTYQPIGIAHGLYNPHDEDLDFVRLAVGVPGETFTTIDLDSDLKNRQPED